MADDVMQGDSDEAVAPEVIPLETAPEIPAFEREQDSLWQRLRALVFGGSDRDLERRLRTLNAAIASTENAPTNYVLRGELYLELGAYALALADFETAEKLATYQFEEHNWGLIAQAMRDRAQAGIAQAMAKRPFNDAAISETPINGHEHHQDSHDSY